MKVMKPLKRALARMRFRRETSGWMGLLPPLWESTEVTVFARDLPGAPPPAPGDDQARRGKVQELMAILPQQPLARELRCHLLDRVGEFFWTVRDRRVLHISWLFRAGDPNPYLILLPGEVMVRRRFTAPGFAGQGLPEAALRKAMRYLEPKGCPRVYLALPARCDEEADALLREGFRPTATRRFRRLCGLRLTPRLRLFGAASPSRERNN